MSDTKTTALSAASMSSLVPEVAVPSYDREAVTTGIVHIGVGAFHRAHLALYIDKLMNQGQALDWAICGVGVLPADSGIRDALAAQDGLYTVVEKHPDGRHEVRVVGSIVEYLFAPDDPGAVIEKMACESTRIVSLTVTEGGYNLNAADGDFQGDNPDVVHDLNAGARPRTTFGLVIEALALRRARGLSPFTVLSCDNIQGNGHAARHSFTSYARLRDPELADWMEKNVRFPNCMVDRITPGTTDHDRTSLAERFGIRDRWPVVCEPFTQWVLEDDFGMGRPALEDVGVQLVPDVEPYELMKLRLLNAGHQALGYLSYLAGHRLVFQACRDPMFAGFLLSYMDQEVTPTLSPVPGIDLGEYKRQLIERFSNPQVRDTVARLCADTSDRIPKWVLPVIRHNLVHGGDVERGALIVAAWARYAEGVDEQDRPIDVVDRLRDTLVPLARAQRDDSLAFIRYRPVFADLVDDERFTSTYRRLLASLYRDGARATLEAVMNR